MRKLFLAMLIMGLSISWAFAQTAIPSNTTQSPVPTVETAKTTKVEPKKKEKKVKKEKSLVVV